MFGGGSQGNSKSKTLSLAWHSKLIYKICNLKKPLFNKIGKGINITRNSFNSATLRNYQLS